MEASRDRAQGVIYFPYINVPDDDSFVRTILYWDEVACIIPAGYNPRDQTGHQHPRLRPDGRTPQERYAHTAELISAGLVSVVEPELPSDQVWPFLEDFLAYVGSTSSTTSGWAESSEPGVSVHRGKLGGMLRGHLREVGLARDKRGPWIEVEPENATTFMACLAAYLGDTAPTRLLPLTDDQHSFEVLRSVAAPLAEREDSHLRDFLLESVLPAPISPEMQWKDLASFKERHQDQLHGFRRYVERELRTLALVGDAREREYQAVQLRLDLRERIEELHSRMRDHGWKNVKLAALEAIAIVTPAGLAASGHPSEAAITAAAGLGAVAYRLLRPSLRALDGEPLAYAVTAHALTA